MVEVLAEGRAEAVQEEVGEREVVPEPVREVIAFVLLAVIKNFTKPVFLVLLLTVRSVMLL